MWSVVRGVVRGVEGKARERGEEKLRVPFKDV